MGRARIRGFDLEPQVSPTPRKRFEAVFVHGSVWSRRSNAVIDCYDVHAAYPAYAAYTAYTAVFAGFGVVGRIIILILITEESSA